MSLQRIRLVPSMLVLGLAFSASMSPSSPTAGALTEDQPSPTYPTTIPLPDGFQPEGIAIGRRPVAYFGSLADGDIYRANLVTGEGRIVSEGPGTPSVGLELDRQGRLFVAGGRAGDARVVDTATGEVLASYQLATEGFVNDVSLTSDAAWFTDSFNPVLYRVPLGHHRELPGPDEVTTVPLTGDLRFQEGFNTNGISRTPDDSALLVVQANTGLLFRVDPATGVTTTVDLGGQTLPTGDGLLLRGRTLYVAQSRMNQVAAVHLDRAGTSGTITAQVTDPRFDILTTVAAFGDHLYLPNARFETEPTPTTPYDVNAIPRP